MNNIRKFKYNCLAILISSFFLTGCENELSKKEQEIRHEVELDLVQSEFNLGVLSVQLDNDELSNGKLINYFASEVIKTNPSAIATANMLKSEDSSNGHQFISLQKRYQALSEQFDDAKKTLESSDKDDIDYKKAISIYKSIIPASVDVASKSDPENFNRSLDVVVDRLSKLIKNNNQQIAPVTQSLSRSEAIKKKQNINKKTESLTQPTSSLDTENTELQNEQVDNNKIEEARINYQSEIQSQQYQRQIEQQNENKLLLEQEKYNQQRMEQEREQQILNEQLRDQQIRAVERERQRQEIISAEINRIHEHQYEEQIKREREDRHREVMQAEYRQEEIRREQEREREILHRHHEDNKNQGVNYKLIPPPGVTGVQMQPGHSMVNQVPTMSSSQYQKDKLTGSSLIQRTPTYTLN
jgi:hypothetical protein